MSHPYNIGLKTINYPIKKHAQNQRVLSLNKTTLQRYFKDKLLNKLILFSKYSY